MGGQLTDHMWGGLTPALPNAQSLGGPVERGAETLSGDVDPAKFVAVRIAHVGQVDRPHR